MLLRQLRDARLPCLIPAADLALLGVGELAAGILRLRMHGVYPKACAGANIANRLSRAALLQSAAAHDWPDSG